MLSVLNILVKHSPDDVMRLLCINKFMFKEALKMEYIDMRYSSIIKLSNELMPFYFKNIKKLILDIPTKHINIMLDIPTKHINIMLGNGENNLFFKDILDKNYFPIHFNQLYLPRDLIHL